MDLGILLVVVAGLLGAWVAFVAVLWLLRPRDARLAELVRLVPDLLRLVRGLLADGDVPLGVRLALLGLLVWLVNPIDIVPEFIPVLGPLDDVVVAILVLRYARRRLGAEELARRWPGTPEGSRILDRILGGT